MTIQELKKSNWIIYSVRSGSHAYGTNFPDSDFDERGIFVLPTEEILKGNYIDVISDKDNDITYYEVGRFLELVENGNPNIAEFLNIPVDCELYVSQVWRDVFSPDVLKSFINQSFKDKFIGYAKSQLRKSRGLNKKINWDKDKITRKTPLDFCYVLMGKEESVKFAKWCDIKIGPKASPIVIQKSIGLAKVNNFVDTYSMYDMGGFGWGIIGESSNGIRLNDIPKDAKHLGYLRFDQNAYSTHCKDYREYLSWRKNRNPLRYKHNTEHGQDFDGKNLLHTVRLLNMATEIMEGKGVIVRRPEAEYLKSIRLGEVDLKKIYEECETKIEYLRTQDFSVKEEVDRDQIENILLKIRKMF
jgi:hypothetical protein